MTTDNITNKTAPKLKMRCQLCHLTLARTKTYAYVWHRDQQRCSILLSQTIHHTFLH